MDTIDRTLMNLLREDARMPLSRIARYVGLSRNAIQSRINRLERDGVILGYTIQSRQDAGVQALMMLEVEVRQQASIIRELRKLSEAISCHTLSGPFDLIVHLGCDTPAALDDVIDCIANIEGVRRTNSSVLLQRKFGGPN